jgi:heme exporter protein B
MKPWTEAIPRSAAQPSRFGSADAAEAGDPLARRASPLLGMLRREWLLTMRRRSEVATMLVFFVLVASLFPLAVGPEPGRLRAIGPGVLWVGALLSTLLGLPRMFGDDFADGTLEQMVLSPTPFAWLVAGKIVAHWLVAGLPLVLLAPLLGLQFGMDPRALGLLVAALLLGTPLLSLLGAIGAALTLGTRGGGALLALLLLPLYVPALVFGAGALTAQAAGLDYTGYLALLGAMLVVAMFLAPAAAAAAVRIAIE